METISKNIVDVTLLSADESKKRIEFFKKKHNDKKAIEKKIFDEHIDLIKQSYNKAKHRIENPVCFCGRKMRLSNTRYGSAMFCTVKNHRRIWNWDGVDREAAKNWAKIIRDDLKFSDKRSKNFISAKHFVSLCEESGLPDLYNIFCNGDTKEMYNGYVKAKNSSKKHEEFLADIIKRLRTVKVLYHPTIRVSYDDGSTKIMQPDIIVVSWDRKKVAVLEVKMTEYDIEDAIRKKQLFSYLQAIRFSSNQKKAHASIFGAYVCLKNSGLSEFGSCTFDEIIKIKTEHEFFDYVWQFSIN